MTKVLSNQLTLTSNKPTKIILLDFIVFECLHLSGIEPPELKTKEWDILNPDQLINLEIKKKRRSSIDLDVILSKALSARLFNVAQSFP